MQSETSCPTVEAVCRECGARARWTSWDGYEHADHLCDVHARARLQPGVDLPSYKDPVTTRDNVTKLNGTIEVLAKGGVKPIDEDYPVIRTREAFDRQQEDELRV